MKETTIHPTALIGPNVKIGPGVTIGPYCVIGFPPEHRQHFHTPGKGVVIEEGAVITGMVTIDAGTEHPTYIGANCFIMKHAHIGHDAILAEGVTVSPGAKIGGHCLIHFECNIGMNACIHQRCEVDVRCMIGMGAVVTKKTIMESCKKYAGVPARIIGENKI